MFRLLKLKTPFVILLLTLIIFLTIFPDNIITTLNILIKKFQLKIYEIQLETLDFLTEQRSIKVIENELSKFMKPKTIEEKVTEEKTTEELLTEKVLEPNKQLKLGEIVEDEARIVVLEVKD